MTRILTIRHVPHERLGTFEPVFKTDGHTIVPLNAADPRAVWPCAADLGGLVIVGGPMGVYEQARYPFLKKELVLLQEVLQAGKPVLGVCLGAQLPAAALGAKVTQNRSKEIGWYPLMREPGANGDPLCESFGQTETVFQWHGDTLALPNGTARLFSSPLCQEQAFRYGDNAYGLQFHIEVTEAMIRTWLANTGNKKELADLRGVIDPTAIRRQSPQHLGRLQELSPHVAAAFCQLLTIRPTPPARRPSHARSR